MQDNLRNYRYVGQDLGFTYNYFWSPLCDRVQKKLPYWLAANTLTMTGFIFGVIPYIVLYVKFGADMQTHVDIWWYWLFFACFATYRFFDELDGKQARGTGNSSPLGMMIDHGVDSYMVSFLASSLPRIFMA